MRTQAIVAAAFALGLSTVRPASAITCAFNNNPYSLNFGNYDPTSGNKGTATITVSFTCTAITASEAITIKANKGDNGPNVGDREMLETGGAGDLLPYMASQSATGSPIFGNGNDSSVEYTTTVTPSDSGVPITFTVYGIIAAAADVEAGTYTDSVTLTMTY